MREFLWVCVWTARATYGAGVYLLSLSLSPSHTHTLPLTLYLSLSLFLTGRVEPPSRSVVARRGNHASVGVNPASVAALEVSIAREREFFIGNLLIRINSILEMIRRTGLAP